MSRQALLVGTHLQAGHGGGDPLSVAALRTDSGVALSVLSGRGVETLKVGGGDPGVELGGIEAGLAGGEDQLDVGVCGEGHDDEAEEGAEGELELLELVRVAGGTGPAGQAVLEGLHDVGEALLAVPVGVAGGLVRLPGGDDQEGGAFIEEDLLGLDGLAQGAELLLDDGQVGDQVVYDAGPGLVQRLVPDGGGKGLDVEGLSGGGADGSGDILESLARLDAHETHALVEDGLLLVRHDQVHLMHEDKHLSGGGILGQGGHDGDIGGEVTVRIAGLDVEHVDQDAHRREDVCPLLVDIVLHKGLLATTVPQVEGQVPQEFDM